MVNTVDQVSKTQLHPASFKNDFYDKATRSPLQTFNLGINVKCPRLVCLPLNSTF